MFHGAHVTDDELIRQWPVHNCQTCGSLARPAIRYGGELIKSDGDNSTVWIVCVKCNIAFSRSRSYMEKASMSGGTATTDMSHWYDRLRDGVAWKEVMPVVTPLSSDEIMAMSPDLRHQILQLRIIFTAVVKAGVNPDRLRATVLGEVTK